MSNVLDFTAAKNKRLSEDSDPYYQALIARMHKSDLLEEMVRFQEERSAKGALSALMMVRGRILFSALERVAETEDLRLLASSYRRHLETELKEFKKE